MKPPQATPLLSRPMTVKAATTRLLKTSPFPSTISPRPSPPAKSLALKRAMITARYWALSLPRATIQ
ncbi:hypothetical protein RO22_06920 [Halomonas sp. KHS3]|nr:hypothetical protein RO22_06920 [Halomonas sp. KHS3]